MTKPVTSAELMLTPCSVSGRQVKSGDLEFVASTRRDAARATCEHVSSNGPALHLHLANAYTIALASTDDTVRNALKFGAINFPDGRPLTWVARLRGGTRLTQVRGPDFFLDVIDVDREYGLRHYLLGSTPDVLHDLQLELMRRYPGVQIAGMHSPPFRPLTKAEITQQDGRILESGANVAWIGSGTPKQDVEAARLSRSTGISAAAVGAAFDFAAGRLKPAPSWVSRAGLQWLFRLEQEPKRLWKRYVFDNVRFLAVAVFGSGNRD